MRENGMSDGMMVRPVLRSVGSPQQRVRALLERFGAPSEVSTEALEACREDLLAVQAIAGRHGAPGSPLASVFRLSDEVAGLIRRLGRGDTPRALAS